MKVFRLPDLGEGLNEAEIAQWHVAEGEEVAADAPLVAVETAKAVVEVPAPWPGKIEKLFARAGEIVAVGAPLVGFAGAEETAPEVTGGGRPDAGTVVGEVRRGEERVRESAGRVGGHAAASKAVPAVRALARRLNVDLAVVTPSGPKGLITAKDVERVAKILSELGPAEPLRGVRRAMAMNMVHSHAEVAPATLMEDADIQAWAEDADITVRLIRAVVCGIRAEPSLNAWFDSHSMGRRVLEKIHLGLAVDSAEGLFVAVLRDIAERTPEDLRAALDRIKDDVANRRVPPEEMRGYTLVLSNFGNIGGRYAAPVVVPPTVAILGAGRIRPEVVAVDGKPAVHARLPLSLTFDHRAVTGGEAGRFLNAVIADLEADA